MTRQFLYILILLSFFSCSNANSGNTVTTKESDIMSIAKSDTLSLAGNSTNKSDSINKANSNTIMFNDDDLQKATVSKSDSSISLTANMKLDHRIFGYDKPDTSSKKMILISIFTNEVEGNPFKCPFGAYYETSDMTDTELKYVSTEGQFIKANIIKADNV